MDNTKEYILCAAYKQKINTVNRQKHINEDGKDIADLYHQPHREVFNMRLGWRHPDILYQYGDEIDTTDNGGFCTSKGRYVDRKEAYRIAVECGQVLMSEGMKEILAETGEYPDLFSEDLY